jgi:hypothetical protein
MPKFRVNLAPTPNIIHGLRNESGLTLAKASAEVVDYALDAGAQLVLISLNKAAELDCRAQDAVRHLGGAATDYIRANEVRMKELATMIVATTKELAAVIATTTAAADARITAMTVASDARVTRIEKNLDLLIRGLRARRRRRPKPLLMNSSTGVSKPKETR